MKWLTKEYYWSDIWNDIRNHIRKCEICQRNKINKHKFHETLQLNSYFNYINHENQLQNSKTHKQRWNMISYSQSRTKWWSMFIHIIDWSNQRIKYNIYYSQNNHRTSQIIQKMNYEQKHQVHESLLNNIHEETWSIKKMFTTYHSQMNKQTKRLNETMKKYLWYYFNYEQNN